MTDELAELVRSELLSQTFGALEMHVAANRIRRILDEIDPPAMPEKIVVEPLLAMSKGEREAFAATEITYGKHAGTRMDELPREYIEWLADAKRTEWRQLRRFLLTDEIAVHAE